MQGNLIKNNFVFLLTFYLLLILYSCEEKKKQLIIFPVNQELVILPFASKPDSPLIQLEVQVEDQPFLLVFDTGTPTTLINTTIPTKKNPNDTSHFHNILFQHIPAQKAFIDSLGLGEIMVINKNSYLQRDLNMDGILGNDIIKNFVWKIDFLNQRVHVSEQIEHFEEQGEGITFKRHGEHIIINAEFKGMDLELIVDTGYSGFMNLYKKTIDTLPNLKPVFWEGVSTSQVGNPFALPSYVPHLDSTYYLTGDLKISHLTLKDEIVELNNIPLNIIGIDFFRRFDYFILDYPNQKIYLGNEQYKSLSFLMYSLMKLNTKGLTLMPSKTEFKIGRITPEIKELGINVKDTILSIDGIPVVNRDSSFYKNNSKFHEETNVFEYRPSPFQSLWHDFHLLSDTSTVEIKRGDSSQIFTLLRQYNFTAMPDSIYDYYIDLSFPLPPFNRVKTKSDTYYFKFKTKELLPPGFQQLDKTKHLKSNLSTIHH